LAARFLADTHVVVRWFAEPQKLSYEQKRILEDSARRREPVAISAISLLEIAALEAARRIRGGAAKILEALGADPLFQILPMTIEIAIEVALLGASLRDPTDRAIVASARVHRLRLLTSDQRIIESKLVGFVD
jgi:PIN domain nuclease of toxin-antitoxin system